MLRVTVVMVLALATSAGCVARGPRAAGSTGGRTGAEPSDGSYAAACCPPEQPRKPREGEVFERGKATWYGGSLHGGPTASGERFNQHAMTAAHKKLPFDTIVRVVNLSNGRSVTVRINDRGPYGKGRIIDVSFAAAKKLDMIDAGVVPCQLEIVKLGKGRYRKNKQPPPGE